MKIMFCVQLLIEMDNPWLYTNFLTNYFKKYIIRLQSACQDIDFGILMGEAPFFIYEKMEGVKTYVLSRQEMLDHGNLDCRQILREYFQYCHERKIRPECMDYHVALVKKYVDFKPDIIISRDNAPYLEECFPEALMLYTEVGFISRKPFPQTMYFDILGMNCGSYLYRYWKEIIKEFEWKEEYGELIKKLKNAVKDCIMIHNPYIEIAKEWRSKYDKLYLLALQFSGFSNIDAEIDFESQLDVLLYVMDTVPQDVGVVVSTHPDYNVLNVGTIRFLRKKYPNFLYHESFLQYNSSSQFLLGLVDGVINLTSTIGLQTLFWDIPNLSIGRYFAEYISRYFNADVSYDSLSMEEKANNDKVMFWLLTHYIITPQLFQDGEWLLSYLQQLCDNNKTKQKYQIYDYLDEPKKIIMSYIESLIDDIPEERLKTKSTEYYDLLVEASKQYFKNNSLREKIIKMDKDILIYGKGSLGYVFELELRDEACFKGYIDRNTLSDYSFTNEEIIIITPVQEYKQIKKEIRDYTSAECISAQDLIRKDI